LFDPAFDVNEVPFGIVISEIFESVGVIVKLTLALEDRNDLGV
jgi:hypothetical protein